MSTVFIIIENLCKVRIEIVFIFIVTYTHFVCFESIKGMASYDNYLQGVTFHMKNQQNQMHAYLIRENRYLFTVQQPSLESRNNLQGHI